MFFALVKKILPSKNERELRRLWPIVEKINALGPAMSALSDSALCEKTDQFRSRIQGGESLQEILPEAFAVVREVSARVLGMRHFDVQLVGGIVLHEGKIAEMKTGEGKTLVATLSLYLNALEGKGVHLVTVNDYLAKRDAQWMGPIYHSLGLSIGVIQHDAAFLYDPSYEAPDRRLQYLRPVPRREAYLADITYGTNNEFGFDYLRDNMVIDLAHCVQRKAHYAIVDEVDSILIDEARTPLIISGPAEESTELYYRIDKIVPHLKGVLCNAEWDEDTKMKSEATYDYLIDEKARTVSLTAQGIARVERMLGVENLYDLANMSLVHHVVQALKAHALFKRDVDYVVKDGEVIIVDEFTGRLMPGRRWSDGLHQAVEAKEGVKIASENQTLATITFQNYFRLYKKLAGMTGTADTEAAEFAKIYNLDVVVIPTHRPMIRRDHSDVVYRTEGEKFAAIVEEIAKLYEKGQPVLVGTISIEKSEKLSMMLKKRGIPHAVLNAKYHEKEAEIIAQAGRLKTITISTNMAGRGTDILLGGNPDFLFKKRIAQLQEASEEERKRIYGEIKAECEENKKAVISLGGLHIIGTERHEARRIDNQLRGRSGRQGDPGSSRFYLSLEDDLLRIFGSDRISKVMQRLGMEEGVPIEHRMVTRAIENAQKRVEAHNFDIRKQLIEYDDVMNQQREIIYEQRFQVIRGENLQDVIWDMIDDRLDQILSLYCPEKSYPEEWDMQGLWNSLLKQFSIAFDETDLGYKDAGREALRERIREKILNAWEKKRSECGDAAFLNIQKMVLLRVIDSQWKDHLLSMDYLKEGIGLRGYGQKDPLIEYKREGFEMFADMIDRIKTDVVENLFRIHVVREDVSKIRVGPRPQVLHENRGDTVKVSPVQRGGKKVGRNDPCPCGSGKKYKKCCGR